MQTTTAQFDSRARAILRPISWQLKMSFTKAFDSDVTFFTLDQSLLDGPDLLTTLDNDVIQEWDKYVYQDFSTRVIDIEVSREEVEPYSVVQAMADITLDNHDGYFTPNSDSPISAYILPKRPTRIMLGFGGSNLPQFIGLTEQMPELDKNAGTAKFHLTDFLSFLFDRKIDDSTMLQNKSTGEILTVLFGLVGVLPAQLDFTATSFNRVPFFYVEKGTVLGTVVRELMEAEQGRLYMNELGIITFQNRQDFSTTPVMFFDKSNTIDYTTSGEDDIINFVELTSNVYTEQVEQSIWQSSEVTLVKAGATAVVWATLQDPATSITTPVYSEIKIGSSHFITTEDVDGTIPNTSITISAISKFAKSAKITFSNAGATDAYVYAIDLWGTPVKVSDTILVEDLDQTSIDQFDEKRYTLETKYIQKRSTAQSKAAIIVDDYKDIGSILEVQVKGNMALQIGDIVTVGLDSYNGNYAVKKITQQMMNGGYSQKLTLKEREARLYFILNQSLLDGTEVLSP